MVVISCASKELANGTTSLAPSHKITEDPPPPATSASKSPAPPTSTEYVVIGSAKKYKEDPTYKPTSCEDVGDHVGYASCCRGQYCAGFCDPKQGCVCGLTSGCLSPEVCSGGCGGPEAAAVHVKKGGIPIAVSALTGEPFPIGSYVNEAKVVDEGNTCGLPEPKNLEEKIQTHNSWLRQSCCQGKICPGLCVTRPSQPEPHCECAGLPGGCVSPHVCCGQGYNVCADADKCPTSSNTWPP